MFASGPLNVRPLNFRFGTIKCQTFKFNVQEIYIQRISELSAIGLKGREFVKSAQQSCQSCHNSNLKHSRDCFQIISKLSDICLKGREIGEAAQQSCSSCHIGLALGQILISVGQILISRGSHFQPWSAISFCQVFRHSSMSQHSRGVKKQRFDFETFQRPHFGIILSFQLLV